MKLQIKVNPDTGVIEDAKFKTFGCGSAIASSSLATEWLKGKTIDEAMAIKNTAIVEELALPPVKVHCSVLAEDAIKAAIKNYQEKQDPAEAGNPAGRGVSSRDAVSIHWYPQPTLTRRFACPLLPNEPRPRREDPETPRRPSPDRS